MKGALAVLGVIVVGAAAYFMARGKSAPAPTTTSAKTPNGTQIAKQVGTQLGTNLLTSANVAAFGGLLNSILPNGGAAKVAPVQGNGFGFVTERDLQPVRQTQPAPAPVDNSYVLTLEDDDGYSG